MGDDSGADEPFHCNRCDESLTTETAIALDGGGVLRILCPDCFEMIGSPAGYEVLRDVSHLSGN